MPKRKEILRNKKKWKAFVYKTSEGKVSKRIDTRHSEIAADQVLTPAQKRRLHISYVVRICEKALADFEGHYIRPKQEVVSRVIADTVLKHFNLRKIRRRRMQELRELTETLLTHSEMASLIESWDERNRQRIQEANERQREIIFRMNTIIGSAYPERGYRLAEDYIGSCFELQRTHTRNWHRKYWEEREREQKKKK